MTAITPAIDYSISFGSILTIVSFIVLGVLYVVTVKGDTKVLAERLRGIDEQIDDFKTDLRKLTEVVSEQGRIFSRLTVLDERILAEGKRMDAIDSRLNKFIDSDQYKDRHDELAARVSILEAQRQRS